MNAPENYKIVKRRPNDLRRSKWMELREKLRSLPDGDSLRIAVPKGKSLRTFAQQLRQGLGRSRKIDITVSENREKNAVEIWEKREPYNTPKTA